MYIHHTIDQLPVAISPKKVPKKEKDYNLCGDGIVWCISLLFIAYFFSAYLMYYSYDTNPISHCTYLVCEYKVTERGCQGMIVNGTNNRTWIDYDSSCENLNQRLCVIDNRYPESRPTEKCSRHPRGVSALAFMFGIAMSFALIVWVVYLFLVYIKENEKFWKSD